MSDQTPLRAGRRLTDPHVAAAEPLRTNLPVPAGQAVTHPPSAKGSAGAFEAQLLTQGTEKRGLRGGKPVLDHARSAYLETEWSGPADRRPAKGILTKAQV